MEAAAMPLPSPETTPPAMKMYFVLMMVVSRDEQQPCRIVWRGLVWLGKVRLGACALRSRTTAPEDETHRCHRWKRFYDDGGGRASQWRLFSRSVMRLPSMEKEMWMSERTSRRVSFVSSRNRSSFSSTL